MATINEIATLDSYRGDANLGGANEIAINIDNKPIQQLAAYTLMYNKNQYDQRQKDADEKIKQLGALAPYDLINGIEKDATELKDAQAKLTEAMAEFAAKGTPKSPAEKIQQDLDFQKKITGQVKLINAANARKIKLDAYKNATQADTKLTAQEKELRIKQAEKLFNDTDINTLPEIPNYGLSTPKNGDAAIETVAVLKNDKDGNAVIDETITQFSIGNTWKNAYLHGNGLAMPTLPTNATEQQKAEYEQQKLAFSKTDMGVWQNAAEMYNAALTDPNYKKTIVNDNTNVIAAPNGTTVVTDEVDVNKIKQDNPIMGGVLALAERYNAYAEKRLQDIKNGYYIDDVTGEKVLLVGGDKEADIKFIDVNKPLKPQDLSFLDMFARAAPDKVDKKLIQTGYGIDRQKMATQIKLEGMQQAGQTERERLQQAGQNFRATLSGKGSGGSGGGDNTKETMNFMDLTGYTGALTTSDIAAIDPTLVISESGVFKLNEKGQKATFKILPNGDVEVNYNDKKKDPTIKVINKGKYQKESIAITQTVLKDRKGEEGNPFTFTGIKATISSDDDTLPIGTILTNADGKKIQTNRVITKKEAADAGYK